MVGVPVEKKYLLNLKIKDFRKHYFFSFLYIKTEPLGT